MDPQGVALANAEVTLTSLTDGKPTHDKTDKLGQLLLRRSRTGQYRLEVSYPGFQSSSETIELRAGEILNFRTALLARGFMGEVQIRPLHTPDKKAVSPDVAATPARSAPGPMQR